MSTHAKLTGKHQYCEFKDETIIARVKKMVEMAGKVDVSNEHIRVSYGNRKTTAMVPSVSLIPIHDCGNCKACKNGCYDIRNVCCYKGSQQQRAVNSAILKQDRERFFKEVELHVQFHRWFRWFIGGDIKDFDFFGRVVGIAVRTPGCQFLLFTKMFDVVNEWLDNVGELPENLHVIFSDWRGQDMDNPHNMPVSSPLWKDGTKGPHCTEKQFMCPGNCSECAIVGCGCWNAKKGETILFEAH